MNTYWKLSDRWSLRAGGNYGGWNVDNVDSTWEFSGGAFYDFKMWGVSSHAFAGYRYLDFELKETRLDFEATIKGPLVGIGWKF